MTTGDRATRFGADGGEDGAMTLLPLLAKKTASA